mgnify:FL=1
MRIIVLAIIFAFSASFAQAGSITLYKGEAFQGESWNISHAVRNFSDNNGWNDTVMSAIVHDGLWEACVDANYQNCVILQGSDMRDFHRIGLDRKISSIREVDIHALRDRHHGQRNAPHNGFSEDFFYSAGQMTGGRSAYYDQGPVLGRAERERFDNSYYGSSHGSGNRNIIWNTPQQPSRGFLSGCQAEVQDAINNRNGRYDEITFTGNPNRGQAIDRFGNRYRYSCNGNQIRIW